jgi:ribonuclease HI
MAYIAWSDGSFLDNKKAYITYIIINEKNKEIARMKAEVEGLKTSYEAEFAALYYLFKKIDQLKIEEINIYTDCLSLYTNLKRKKRKRGMNYNSDLAKRIENKFGIFQKKKFIESLHWKSRDYNLAHYLFAGERKCELITDFIKEFGALERTSKKYRQQKRPEFLEKRMNLIKNRNFEKMIRNGTLNIKVLNEDLKIPLKVLNTASKVFNESGQNKIIQKLEKKMKKMSIEVNQNGKVFRKGRIEINVSNKVIKEIKVVKKNYLEQYREKGDDLFKSFDLDKIIKKSQKSKQVFDIEGIEYKITEKTYNALKRKMGTMKIKGFLTKNISQGMIIEKEGVRIIVKGEVHLIIQNNVIINFTLILSDYTKKWLESKKTA